MEAKTPITEEVRAAALRAGSAAGRHACARASHLEQAGALAASDSLPQPGWQSLLVFGVQVFAQWHARKRADREAKRAADAEERKKKVRRQCCLVLRNACGRWDAGSCVLRRAHAAALQSGQTCCADCCAGARCALCHCAVLCHCAARRACSTGVRCSCRTTLWRWMTRMRVMMTSTSGRMTRSSASMTCLSRCVLPAAAGCLPACMHAGSGRAAHSSRAILCVCVQSRSTSSHARTPHQNSCAAVHRVHPSRHARLRRLPVRRQQRQQQSRRQQRPAAAAAQMQQRARAAALRQQTVAPAAVEPPARRWLTSMRRCLRVMTTLMTRSCWMTVMMRTLTTSSCSSWSSSYSRKRLCRELLARQAGAHLSGVGQGLETGQNCVWGEGEEVLIVSVGAPGCICLAAVT